MYKSCIRMIGLNGPRGRCPAVNRRVSAVMFLASASSSPSWQSGPSGSFLLFLTGALFPDGLPSGSLPAPPSRPHVIPASCPMFCVGSGGEPLFKSFRAYAMRGDSTAEEAIAHIRSFIEGGKPAGPSDPEARAKAPVPPGFFAVSPDQRKSPEAAPSGPGPGPGRRLGWFSGWDCPGR